MQENESRTLTTKNVWGTRISAVVQYHPLDGKEHIEILFVNSKDSLVLQFHPKLAKSYLRELLNIVDKLDPENKENQNDIQTTPHYFSPDNNFIANPRCLRCGKEQQDDNIIHYQQT